MMMLDMKFLQLTHDSCYHKSYNKEVQSLLKLGKIIQHIGFTFMMNKHRGIVA